MQKRLLQRINTLRPRLSSYPACLLGAFFYFLALEPIGLWPLGLVALVPWYLQAWEGNHSLLKLFWRSFLQGLFLNLLIYHWIWNFFAVGMPFVVVTLSLYYAAGWTLIGLVSRRAPRLRLPGSLFIVLLVELLRSSGEFSLQWGLAGHTLAASSLLRQGAAILGVWGLSLLVVVVNIAIADRFFHDFGKSGSWWKWGAVALLGVTLLFGGARLLLRPPDTTLSGRISLIQTGSDSGRWQREISQQADRAFRLFLDALKAGPSLVVFPETVFPFNLSGYYKEAQKQNKSAPQSLLLKEYSQLQIAPRALSLARIGKVPVLLPIPLHKEGRAWNSVVLLMPEARPGHWKYRYDKRALVPFGEFLPWRPLLRFLEPLLSGAGVERFTAGRQATLFRSGDWPYGILICYEDMFPELGADAVRLGARALFNVTSDARFNSRIASGQHLGGAVLTAVACGVPLYRTANTGVTALVNSRGDVVSRLPQFTSGLLVLPRSSGRGGTFFVRFGHYFKVVLWILSGAFLLLFVMVLLLKNYRTRFYEEGLPNREEKQRKKKHQ